MFLSNGPGDPEPCDYAIEAIGKIVDIGVPTFGICLGHQLLGLASGAKTVKMKFGHHGANHPVVEIDSGRVMITSQNHGFAVAGGNAAGERARDPPLVVRRHAAGYREDRSSRRFLVPGPSRGEPGAARPEAAVPALHGCDEGLPAPRSGNLNQLLIETN